MNYLPHYKIERCGSVWMVYEEPPAGKQITCGQRDTREEAAQLVDDLLRAEAEKCARIDRALAKAGAR